jgi:hypothetical protein
MIYRDFRAELCFKPSSEFLMSSITNVSFDIVLSNKDIIDYKIVLKDQENGFISL